jgi:hypothetical protein
VIIAVGLRLFNLIVEPRYIAALRRPVAGDIKSICGSQLYAVQLIALDAWWQPVHSARNALQPAPVPASADEGTR